MFVGNIIEVVLAILFFSLVLLVLIEIRSFLYHAVDDEGVKLLFLTKDEDVPYKKEIAYSAVACLLCYVIKKVGTSDEKMRLVKNFVEEHYSDSGYLNFPEEIFKKKKKDSELIMRRIEKMLNFKKMKNYRFYCVRILRGDFSYEKRLELLSAIFSVVLHEGIDITGVQLLRNIAHFLLIDKEDLMVLESQYGVTEQKKTSQTDYLHNLYIHTLSQSYRTLELEPSVKKEEIKRAYRRLAMKYHPDRLPVDATEEVRLQAASQFRLVNEAYDYLCKEREIV